MPIIVNKNNLRNNTLSKSIETINQSSARITSGNKHKYAGDNIVEMSIARNLSQNLVKQQLSLKTIANAELILQYSDITLTKAYDTLLKMEEIATSSLTLPQEQKITLKAQYDSLNKQFNDLIVKTEINGNKLFHAQGSGVVNTQAAGPQVTLVPGQTAVTLEPATTKKGQMQRAVQLMEKLRVAIAAKTLTGNRNLSKFNVFLGKLHRITIPGLNVDVEKLIKYGRDKTSSTNGNVNDSPPSGIIDQLKSSFDSHGFTSAKNSINNYFSNGGKYMQYEDYLSLDRVAFINKYKTDTTIYKDTDTYMYGGEGKTMEFWAQYRYNSTAKNLTDITKLMGNGDITAQKKAAADYLLALKQAIIDFTPTSSDNEDTQRTKLIAALEAVNYAGISEDIAKVLKYGPDKTLNSTQDYSPVGIIEAVNAHANVPIALWRNAITTKSIVAFLGAPLGPGGFSIDFAPGAHHDLYVQYLTKTDIQFKDYYKETLATWLYDLNLPYVELKSVMDAITTYTSSSSHANSSSNIQNQASNPEITILDGSGNQMNFSFNKLSPGIMKASPTPAADDDISDPLFNTTIDTNDAFPTTYTAKALAAIEAAKAIILSTISAVSDVMARLENISANTESNATLTSSAKSAFKDANVGLETAKRSDAEMQRNAIIQNNVSMLNLIDKINSTLMGSL